MKYLIKRISKIHGGKPIYVPSTDDERTRYISEIKQLAPGSVVKIMGPGGSGKTYFINQLIENFTKVEPIKNVKVTGMTAQAANLISGRTLQSFFAVQKTNPLLMHLPLFFEILPKFTEDNKKIFIETDYLIIDEASMLSVTKLQNIDIFLRNVRSNPNIKYGGMKLIFVGDPFQLPPIPGSVGPGIYRNCPSSENEYNVFFLPDESDYTIVFNILRRQADAEDTESQDILRQINLGIINEDENVRLLSIDLLNKFCVPRFLNQLEEDKLIDTVINCVLETGAIIITPTHKREKQYLDKLINKIKLEGKKIYEIRKPEKFMNELHKEQIIKKCGGEYGLKHEEEEILDNYKNNDFIFFEDCSIRIAQNFSYDENTRFINGEDAVFKRYIDDPENPLIEIERNLDKQIYRIPQQELKSEFLGDLQLGYKVFPIKIHYVSTIHGVQGLTIDKKVILDLTGLLSFQKQLLQLLYVAVSRVKRLSDLCIIDRINLEPFKSDIINSEITRIWTYDFIKHYPRAEFDKLKRFSENYNSHYSRPFCEEDCNRLQYNHDLGVFEKDNVIYLDNNIESGIGKLLTSGKISWLKTYKESIHGPIIERRKRREIYKKIYFKDGNYIFENLDDLNPIGLIHNDIFYKFPAELISEINCLNVSLEECNTLGCSRDNDKCVLNESYIIDYIRQNPDKFDIDIVEQHDRFTIDMIDEKYIIDLIETNFLKINFKRNELVDIIKIKYNIDEDNEIIKEIENKISIKILPKLREKNIVEHNDKDHWKITEYYLQSKEQVNVEEFKPIIIQRKLINGKYIETVKDVEYVFETEISEHPIGYVTKKRQLKTFPQDILEGFKDCYKKKTKSLCGEKIEKCQWINKKKPFPDRCIYKGDDKDKYYKNFFEYWNYKLKE